VSQNTCDIAQLNNLYLLWQSFLDCWLVGFLTYWFLTVVRVLAEILNKSIFKTLNQTITYHSPCTMQHGQQLGGFVESILKLPMGKFVL
jgi:Fe-S oxidoreductase